MNKTKLLIACSLSGFAMLNTSHGTGSSEYASGEQSPTVAAGNQQEEQLEGSILNPDGYHNPPNSVQTDISESMQDLRKFAAQQPVGFVKLEKTSSQEDGCKNSQSSAKTDDSNVTQNNDTFSFDIGSHNMFFIQQPVRFVRLEKTLCEKFCEKLAQCLKCHKK